MTTQTKTEMIPVGFLPAIQRDLYLSRCVRRTEDEPLTVDTFNVVWSDMVVSFEVDTPVAKASVEVSPEISVAVFTKRLESLIDCGTRSEGSEWVLKWSDRISRYGSVEQVRRLLCDKIASIDNATEETIGVLKIKRRSVQEGHAKIRLVPDEDSLQIILRHTSAQGLKSVWKSVLWRLQPQHPTQNYSLIPQGVKVINVWAPCVRVQESKGDRRYSEKANWLSEQGVSVDLSKDIDVTIPLAAFKGTGDLPYYTAKYYCRVEVELSVLPAGKPEGISVDNGVIEIEETYSSCLKNMKAVSDWLGLGWKIPTQQATSSGRSSRGSRPSRRGRR